MCLMAALVVCAVWTLESFAWAQTSQLPGQVCPRPEAGATVSDPPELESRNGLLEVTLHFKYQTTLMGQGPPRYCYLTDDGMESPTLRVHPGDRLVIHLHNDLPQTQSASMNHPMLMADPKTGDTSQQDCNDGPMSASVTNLHFHGLNIPPVCHQDDVIHTLVQPGGD